MKYGLKIWSINKNLFKEAVNLVKNGAADFIELYTVPGSLDEKDLEIFKTVPVTLHAPHETHDFNIFSFDQSQIDFFNKQVAKIADFLNSPYIILHAGVDRTGEGFNKNLFKENTAKIYDKRILIENLTKSAIGGGVCFGHSQEQLRFIKNDCGFDLCFDLVHAAKGAVEQKIDYKDFIGEALAAFAPFYFHICGTELVGRSEDEHLNLFEGNFDMKWAKEKLAELATEKDIWLVFEVPKIGNNLENDIKNIEFFKNL